MTRMLAALLCGTLFAAPAAAEELKFWTLTFSAQKANDALKQIESEFEASHPGVDVVFVQRGTDDHKTALRVAAGSDTGPDIYFSWAGLGLGGEYVKAGMSRPLDAYYEKYGWTQTLLPAAAAFADLYEGGKHGVPFSFKGEALYYNKALFEKAGITEEPKTYDELLGAAEKLKAAGIPAITFGGTVNWHLMRLMDVLLETRCGADTHDRLKEMAISWSETPCATDAFAELKRWSDNYLLKPFMGISSQQSFTLFANGRAAMMLEGSWLVQQLSEVTDLNNFGIVPFPTGTDRLYGFGEYSYISTKAANPDLAAEFLDFMNSKDMQQKVLGLLTPTSVNAQVEYKDLRPLDAEWVEIFKVFPRVYMNGDQGFPGDVTPEFFRVINEVATGGLEPKAAADALQAFIDARA